MDADAAGIVEGTGRGKLLEAPEAPVARGRVTLAGTAGESVLAGVAEGTSLGPTTLAMGGAGTSAAETAGGTVAAAVAMAGETASDDAVAGGVAAG